MKIFKASNKTEAEAFRLAECAIAVYPICEGHFCAVYFDWENEQILRNMAEVLAARGGSAKSAAKSRAAKANGKKGGRPKKKK